MLTRSGTKPSSSAPVKVQPTAAAATRTTRARERAAVLGRLASRTMRSWMPFPLPVMLVAVSRGSARP